VRQGDVSNEFGQLLVDDCIARRQVGLPGKNVARFSNVRHQLAEATVLPSFHDFSPYHEYSERAQLSPDAVSYVNDISRPIAQLACHLRLVREIQSWIQICDIENS
jgi:hypothetical protein